MHTHSDRTSASVPTLSFVVPAYNEERLLGATLESIHAAARPLGIAYEIVVADDASTDATAAIAEAAGARVVGVENRKISATRNAGAKAAAGERLIFVDADTRVNPAVVAAAMRAMDQGIVGGGAGVGLDGDAPRWGRILVALTAFVMRNLNLAAGCFVYCTREAFEAVGGFDERHYAAEEVVISRALQRQGRFVVLREAVVTSPRKLYLHTPWSMLVTGIKLVLRGTKGVQERRHTDFWYYGKR